MSNRAHHRLAHRIAAKLGKSRHPISADLSTFAPGANALIAIPQATRVIIYHLSAIAQAHNEFSDMLDLISVKRISRRLQVLPGTLSQRDLVCVFALARAYVRAMLPLADYFALPPL